jgi:hypothetical protein
MRKLTLEQASELGRLLVRERNRAIKSWGGGGSYAI